MTKKESYQTYMNYKKIIEAVQKERKSILDISQETNISISTISRFIHNLLDENVIEVSSHQEFHRRGVQRVRRFKLKNGEA